MTWRNESLTNSYLPVLIIINVNIVNEYSDLSRDCVENLLVPEYYEASHVSNNLSLEELFAHVNLKKNEKIQNVSFRICVTWISGSHISAK